MIRQVTSKVNTIFIANLALMYKKQANELKKTSWNDTEIN